MTVSATFFEIKSLAANWTFSLELNLLGGPVVSSRLFSTQYTCSSSIIITIIFFPEKKNAALESSMPGELCMPSRKDYKRPLDHINTVATLGSNFVLIFSICTPPIKNLFCPPPPPPPLQILHNSIYSSFSLGTIYYFCSPWISWYIRAGKITRLDWKIKRPQKGKKKFAGKLGTWCRQMHLFNRSFFQFNCIIFPMGRAALGWGSCVSEDNKRSDQHFIRYWLWIHFF